jgi:hypothetical protein
MKILKKIRVSRSTYAAPRFRFLRASRTQYLEKADAEYASDRQDLTKFCETLSRWVVGRRTRREVVS